MLKHIQWAKKDYGQTTKQNKNNKMNKIYKKNDNINKEEKMIF